MMRPSDAVAWWHSLQPDPEHRSPGNRAALARLRRCATTAEAIYEPATIHLSQRCGATGPWDMPAICLTAAVLAHVREDDQAHPSIARHVGPENIDKPETALLKPLRFQRLIESETPDERLTAFRRLVAIARGRLNLRDLAAALLLPWDDERRRRWVYSYWNADQPVRNGGTA